MQVTKEELRKYQDLEPEIREIQMQIDALYHPIKSAPITSTGAGRSSAPGDPTARAFDRLEKARKRLEQKQEELYQLKDKIEEWVEEIDDGHVRRIVRLHFLLGRTWKQTCREIYGYADPDICRAAFNRFMEKQKDGTDKHETN